MLAIISTIYTPSNQLACGLNITHTAAPASEHTAPVHPAKHSHPPLPPSHRPCPEQFPFPLHSAPQNPPYRVSEHGSHHAPPYPPSHTHPPPTHRPCPAPPHSQSPTQTPGLSAGSEQFTPPHPL